MVGDGKGMYHYKVCKAIRIDVYSYSRIYVYTAIQEYTYMAIWKYRNTAIKICRYIERRESILHPTMWAVSASLCPSAFGFSFLRPELFLSFRCNRHLEPFMCKVKSQALRGHKAKNWPVKVFRKPQSMISEGHEKFSANRKHSGVCRVPCLRYLCRIKVDG